MTIARRALPELLGRPRVFWAGVLQVHLGAASLATNADVGVVHGEIVVFPHKGSQPRGISHTCLDGIAGARRQAGRLAGSRLRPLPSGLTTRSYRWRRPARGRARN